MTDATLIAADRRNHVSGAQRTGTSRAGQEIATRERRSPGDPRGNGKFPTTRTIVARTPTPPWPRKDRDAPCNSNTKCIRRSTPRRASFSTRTLRRARVHDSQPYLEQLQRVSERHGIHIREATADRGYGSAAIIRYLQQQGIETYIPLWSGRSGSSKYLKGELVYEKEYDRFRCPQGKYLTPNPAITENQKRYVSSSEDCRHCLRASTCPARTRGQSPQRFVLRNLDQDLFEEVTNEDARPRVPARNGPSACGRAKGCLPRRSGITAWRAPKYRGRCKVQNSGLPQRDRPEPEAPRRANLLLARGLLVTQANKISLIAEVDEFRDRLFQQARMSY